MESEQETRSVHIEVTNIGGIDSAELQFSPGVTILSGRNATNRTSMLRAIMAALGSDRISLKGNADQGSVELTLRNKPYTRTLTRHTDNITISGEPYLNDGDIADLFAFLLEDNPIRQVIRSGYNDFFGEGDETYQYSETLRDVIMRPVDMEEIEAEINDRQQELIEVDAELDQLTGLESQLEQKKKKKEKLEMRIDDLDEKIETKKNKLQEVDVTNDQSTNHRTKREEKLSQLKEQRKQLEDVIYELESQQETIEALQDEQVELEANIDDLPEEVEDRAKIDQEIEQLQRRKQSIDNTINQLQRIIKFNNNVLEADSPEILKAIDRNDDSSEPLTDQLLDSTIRCWTCGQHVERSKMENVVEQLQGLYQEKVKERNVIKEEIKELRDRLQEIEKIQSQQEKIEGRLNEIDEEIDEHKRRRTVLEERREELKGTVDNIEAELDEIENTREHNEILELHKEINELEVERDTQRKELEEVRKHIEKIEKQLETEEELQDRREELQAEIQDLRVHVKQLEKRVVEEFNEHMETILDILDYENLDRVWIERLERDTRKGQQTIAKGSFEVHVVRSSKEGVMYEDTIEHLSESEREVTGLVCALAGYLAHEVYETVPVMILDSLEALDTVRIARLIAYFSDYTEFLIVSLLPEDVPDLPDEYEQIEFPL